MQKHCHIVIDRQFKGGIFEIGFKKVVVACFAQLFPKHHRIDCGPLSQRHSTGAERTNSSIWPVWTPISATSSALDLRSASSRSKCTRTNSEVNGSDSAQTWLRVGYQNASIARFGSPQEKPDPNEVEGEMRRSRSAHPRDLPASGQVCLSIAAAPPRLFFANRSARQRRKRPVV